MRKTAAIQAGGYLVLLALSYLWLGMADSSVWQVLLSGVLALAIASGAVWLIAKALAVPSWKSLLWLLAAAAAAGGCAWLSARMKSTYMPLLWVAGTAAVVAVLPLAAGAAGVLRQWRYWAVAALMGAAGLLLPRLLVGWVPKFQGFGAQTASLVVRFVLAYAIALAAWLGIASLPRRMRSAG